MTSNTVEHKSIRLLGLLRRRAETCHRFVRTHKIDPLAIVDLMKIRARMNSLEQERLVDLLEIQRTVLQSCREENEGGFGYSFLLE
jgi:hypothetical protein